MGCGSRTDTVVMRSRRSRTGVELLTAYSHSVQAADLLLCHTVALASPVRAARPSAKRPWNLRERLHEREIAELITAYRDGATAASLAATHGVSLRSVKRLLYTAGVRRTPSTRGSAKTRPTTTYP
jgi:2,4-dienoyl-CoA reductase-like NADH-dependent reductase (Old Yellow Enzyme family)